MIKTYKGISIEVCLDLAAIDLDIDKSVIVYTVLEKKGLFKKEFTINVEVPYKEILKKGNGTIKVEDGKIIVKNPTENGSPAIICPSNFAKIKVDDIFIAKEKDVYEHSIIEYYPIEEEASRTMDIIISPDNLKAFLSINYEAKKNLELKNCKDKNKLELEFLIKDRIFPPKFKISEIKEELSKKHIAYGIIDKTIENCVEKEEVKNIVIAQGQAIVDEVDDYIDFKFEIDSDIKQLKEDKEGNIDFKSIGAVSAIQVGAIIAVKVSAENGTEGIDIFGNKKKFKVGKKLNLKVSDGCKLQDENTVVAETSGKPCIKNGTFYIFKLHEIAKDVDLKTGNINFVGDIVIHGEVKEGMQVISGNSIVIDGNIERSVISGKGDIILKGNVIASKVNGGGEDLAKLKIIQNLGDFYLDLKNMIDAIEEIKKFNLLGYDITDGNIIKVLVENKFKNIPRYYMNAIKDATVSKDPASKKMIVVFKEKLIGLAPLSIKHYSELYPILEMLEGELLILRANQSLPVTVKVGYCQDSEIVSSGDIIFTGSGLYISNVSGNDKILFLQDRCVTRGGSIKAGSEIRSKIVGSEGGVATRLSVNKEGHIWIDLAYENTILTVGSKEYVLDSKSRNVHAYINEDYELVVDKLKY